MSTRAAVGTTLRRGALGTLPVVAAGCAAAASVLLARRFPAVLVALAAAVGCALLVIRVDLFRALLPLAFARAALEGWQDHIIIRALGVQLSIPDLLTIALLAGSVWWLVDRARAGDQIWQVPTFFPALLLLSLAVASLVYSTAPAIGARDLVKFAAAYALFIVVVIERPSVERLKTLLALIVASAVVPIAVGWWQLSESIGRGSGRPAGLRIQSTFDHPNTYGFYLVSIVAAAWGLRGMVSSRFRPVVDAVGIAALASSALTLSRNTWGALTIVVLVIGWRDRRLLVAAALSAGIAALAMPRLLIRATDFLYLLQGSNTGNSLVGRLDLWSRDLALWQTHPILGLGWGSVSAQVEHAAHNDYLRSLTEAGVIGFIAFLFLIGSLIRMGIRSGRWRSDLPRALMGLSVGYALVSLASNNLGKGAFQFYFWLIAAIAYVWSQTVPDGGADPGLLEEAPP